MNVQSGPVTVGALNIQGLASASSLLMGDTESIVLYSYFDTPPESVIVGPLVPFPAIAEEEEAEG
ncbi:spore gernimation protein GerPD [Cohnella sp. CBP 2801]|uniref:Spore gernimation protein GerPD n=2 Tax=Cohnella zeiphila TaxID=2761120 RepID=A0A7X0SKD7_9BACL|nr:spore gernimation protein GerPD [Cohnella zeiphila]